MLSRNAAAPAAGRRFPIRAANGHIVAEVVGGVLRKRIQASRHFLRQPPAIAFDLCVLAEAERLGASQVEVLDRESGCIYAAPLWAFERWGLRLDRGFGRQAALRLERWAVSGPGQPVVRQLQLFGESF